MHAIHPNLLKFCLIIVVSNHKIHYISLSMTIFGVSVSFSCQIYIVFPTIPLVKKWETGSESHEPPLLGLPPSPQHHYKFHLM